MTNSLVILKLDSKIHDCGAFDCGQQDLNRFLKEFASQFVKRGDAYTYVLVETNQPTEIIGFYTLTSGSVDQKELPDIVSKGRPQSLAMPVTLLGKMGVSLAHQGKSHGRRMLMDAMKKVVESTIASAGLLVDAKPEALAFYLKFDFIPFRNQPLRLILPLKSIQALVRPI